MNPPKAERSIYHHMLRGASWTVLMRWVMRGVGLVNTVILARLLTPEDFGVVALGLLMVSMLRLLLEGSVDMWLIREPGDARELADTVWTCRVLQYTSLSLIVVAATPLVVNHFDEPRLALVIPLLALGSFVQGFVNVGITLARKHLDFALDFRYNVISRLSTFVVTVTAAVVLRNYWALVIGTLFGAILDVALSYWLHPYRPRPCLARWRALVRFMAQMFNFNMARSLLSQLPLFVVGTVANTAASGLFQVSLQFAAMPTQEVLGPVGRALVPTYSKLATKPAELASAYLATVGALYAVCLPVGIGLSATAAFVVPVVFGEKWLDAIPLVAGFAVFATVGALAQAATGSILFVIKREARAALLSWVRLLVVGSSIAYGGFVLGVQAIPLTATIGGFTYLLVVTAVVGATLGISNLDYIKMLWRPMASTAVMWWAVTSLPTTGLSDVVALGLSVAVGALTYTATLLALWVAQGRPTGAESGLMFLLRRGRAKV